MDSVGAFDNSYIMTDVDALASYSLYQGMEASIDKDSFRIYSKSDTIEELALDLTIEHDLSTAYVTLPPALAASMSGKYIGLGLQNVYPSVWIEI